MLITPKTVITAMGRSSLKRVDDLEAYLYSKGFASRDGDACLEYLELVQKHSLRRPKPTARAGDVVLSLKPNALKKKCGGDRNKRAALREQIFLAHIDAHEDENLSRAKALLEELRRFVEKDLGVKRSRRLRRLEGMLMEASGEFEKALGVYEEILGEHPTDQRVMKRKIAVLESRRDLRGCFEALSEYLDVFMDDVEAWEHCGKLYAKCFMHEQAIFCFEECVCSSPSNYHHHRRVAEQLYSSGGVDNLRQASMHYAAAIDMSSGEDVRSLYGCIMTHNKLSSIKNSSGGGENNAHGLDAVKNLAAAAAERLEQLYAVKQGDLLHIVKSTIV